MQACCAVIIAVVLGLLSPGWTHLRTSVLSPDGRKVGFKGLRHLYDAGARPIDTIKLVVVHGMGEHQRDYSKTLTDGVAARMNLPQAAAPPPSALEALGDGVAVPADFKYAELHRRLYQGGGKTLEVFEVDWFPLADTVKGTFEQDDDAQASGRAWVNEHLKTSLVNDSLSDPLIYLGAGGPFIRNAVKQVMCEAVHGKLRGPQGHEICDGASLEARAAVAFVTMSLGSRVAFDSLDELLASEPAPPGGTYAPGGAQPGAYQSGCARQLLGSTASVFMLANQLPLLGLAHTSPAEATHAAQTAGLAQQRAVPGRPRSLAVRKSALSGVLDAFRAIRRSPGQRLEVVTISDPNDLLSYAVPKDFADAYQADDIQFVNVTTLIAERFALGTVANPVQAHTGHVGSGKVMKLLVEGVAAPAGGS